MVLNTTGVWYPITPPTDLPLAVTLNSGSNVTTTTAVSNGQFQSASEQFANMNFVITEVDVSGNPVYLTNLYVANNTEFSFGQGLSYLTDQYLYLAVTSVILPFSNVVISGTLLLQNLNIPMTFYTYALDSNLLSPSLEPISLETAVANPKTSYLQGSQYTGTVTDVFAFLTEDVTTSSVGTVSYAGLVSATIGLNAYCTLNPSFNSGVGFVQNNSNYISVQSTQVNLQNSTNLGMIFNFNNTTFEQISFTPNLTSCRTSGVINPVACNTQLVNCSTTLGNLVLYNVSNTDFSFTTKSGSATCTGFAYTVTNNPNLIGPTQANNYNLSSSTVVQSITLNFTATCTSVLLVFTIVTNNGTLCFSIQTNFVSQC
jgi:hypothetical protein